MSWRIAGLFFSTAAASASAPGAWPVQGLERRVGEGGRGRRGGTVAEARPRLRIPRAGSRQRMPPQLAAGVPHHENGGGSEKRCPLITMLAPSARPQRAPVLRTRFHGMAVEAQAMLVCRPASGSATVLCITITPYLAAWDAPVASCMVHCPVLPAPRPHACLSPRPAKSGNRFLDAASLLCGSAENS